MEKMFLSDNSGKFFDLDKVERIFNSEVNEDETMYLTNKDSWVLCIGKQIMANRIIEEKDPQEAAQWFEESGYDFEDVPEELQGFLGEEI